MHAYVYYMGYWLIQYGILAYTMQVRIDSARSMHMYTIWDIGLYNAGMN